MGDAIENPLLFRMGLSLAQQGGHPATVEEIYGGFVVGLAARAGVPRPDAALVAAGCSCLELIAEERFAADAYWWRGVVGRALETLRDSGEFDLDGVTADDAISKLVEIGIVHERGAAAQIAFLHDSFRDYLSALTLREGYAPLPDPFDERYELAAELLAQGTKQASGELLMRLCDNPVAAARAAELPLDVPDPTPELAQMLLRRLLSAFSFPSVPVPAELGVSALASPDRHYVVLHEGNGLTLSDAAELNLLAREARLMIAFAVAPTSLRAAVHVWQELLREALEQVVASGRPWQIPTEPEPLAVAVGDYFRAKQQETIALAAVLCPAMSERIVETVAWRGMKARLQPEPEPEPMGGHPYHRLSYTYDHDTVNVEIGQLSDEMQSSLTTAENFMQQAPEAAASAAIKGGLKALLATWGA